MTFYGLNPSFVYNSPLPLYKNAIRRGKRFEVCDASGRPTGVESPLGEDGLPVSDRRQHGVRMFASEPVPALEPALGPENVALSRGGGGLVCAHADTWFTDDFVTVGGGGIAPFHGPSMAALAALRPTVLRTLDLSKANLRPDWSRPRVRPSDLLQGSDRGMCVEHQALLAKRLKCALWWNAPPRFELTVAEYEARLEELLTVIRDEGDRAPILEYGNELWNAGFAVHRWLESLIPRIAGQSSSVAASWQQAAAVEIALLKRVADRVFGGHGPLGARAYYLFVGGQLTVPSHLDKILGALGDLGVTPDLAGPALYVTPLKAHVQEWEATKAVPTQDELRSSCMARLEEIAAPGVPSDSPAPAGYKEFIGVGPLEQHDLIRKRHGVPYFACYEAGQSLIAGSHPWRKAAIEAQKTEWMGQLYSEIRRVAETAGIDLCLWYSAATDQAPGDARVDVFGLLGSTDLTKMLPKALAARGD